MPEPSPTERPEPDTERPGPRRHTPLPFGPFGMAVVTLIALTAAFGAARVMIAILDDDDTVDVQDALNQAADAPLVSDTETRAKVGEHAPNVRLEYLDGGVQELAEVAGRGTPVVVNFWSSTCRPCIKEMPAIQRVADAHPDAITVVGVDVTDSREAGEEMVALTGVTYRNARDPRGEIFAVFGGIALPRTILIDGDGVVVDTKMGELTEGELTDLLVEHGFVEA